MNAISLPVHFLSIPAPHILLHVLQQIANMHWRVDTFSIQWNLGAEYSIIDKGAEEMGDTVSYCVCLRFKNFIFVYLREKGRFLYGDLHL